MHGLRMLKRFAPTLVFLSFVLGCQPEPPTPIVEDEICRISEAASETEHEQQAWLQAFFHDCIDEVEGKNAAYKGWVKDEGGIRLTGPRIANQAFGSHQRVQVYYSPSMAAWLKDKSGPPPVGARMVKEMFVDFPGESDDRDGVAFMQRIDDESADGWLWALFFRPNSPSTGRKTGFISAQRGVSFCQSCHGVVADGDGTFAHLGNLTGKDVVSYTDLPGVLQDQIFPDAAEQGLVQGPHGIFAMVGSLTTAAGSACLAPLGVGSMPCDRELDPSFHKGDGCNPSQLQLKNCTVSMIYNDYLIPGSANPTDWLSSDSCQHCHDVALLQAGRTPEMMLVEPVTGRPERKGQEHRFFNLSPYGEAASSLMARSVRDPIFLAQLEYERERMSDAPDKVTDFCLSCHAPMGHRAYHGEASTLKPPFPESLLYQRPGESGSAFAGLARNGVSCNVCHRIEKPENLKEAYNANFEVGPMHRIYGPYDDPKGHAMAQSIGVTELLKGDQLASGEVCTSCHTVKPPIVRPDQAHDDWSELPMADEQMTWWEWNASEFADPDTGENCVDCHMPQQFGGEIFQNDVTTLDTFRIANIQAPDFPYTHAHPDPDDVDLPVRTQYRRHTLSGINLFAMELFRFYGFRLGIQSVELGLPTYTFNRSELASREALAMARTRTARIELTDLEVSDEILGATVKIENLVGHKFPSGVHFRRAWIELAAYSNDRRVWCSGCPDADGWIGFQIGDKSGRLASENAKHTEDLQRHWPVIKDARQVRIYEEAYVESNEPNAELSASFLGLAYKVKDTKLLPKGFNPDSPFAGKMLPIDCAEWPGECSSPDLVGGDIIRYKVPIDEIEDKITHVKARLHVQAVSPPYLRDIGVLSEDTKRAEGRPRRADLATVIGCLKTQEDRLFKDWTVEVACTKTKVDGGSESCLAEFPLTTTDLMYALAIRSCK